jgi:hypothetical protein
MVTKRAVEQSKKLLWRKQKGFKLVTKGRQYITGPQVRRQGVPNSGSSKRKRAPSNSRTDIRNNKKARIRRPKIARRIIFTQKIR